MDVILAWAFVATQSGKTYVRPTLVDTSAVATASESSAAAPAAAAGHGGGRVQLSLKRARHPCLEALDGVNFIANDVHFERGVSEFHIIT